MLFPTKSAALCLQQEVGFIYKNHSPKLIFVGLCTFLISLSCSTHPPSEDSSVTTEQEALKNAVENDMDKHWRVFSRGGNRGLKSSVTHPREQNMWVSRVPSHCVPHCTVTALLHVPPAQALHRHAILPRPQLGGSLLTLNDQIL